MRKIKVCLIEFVKKTLLCGLSSCPFTSCMRNNRCLTLHHLPDKKLRPSLVSGCGADCLGGIVVYHSLYLTNKFGSSFLIRPTRMRLSDLLYLHNYNWTLPTLFRSFALSSNGQLNTLKSLYWSFQCKCHTVQYAISKFLVECIVSWCCLSSQTMPNWL